MLNFKSLSMLSCHHSFMLSVKILNTNSAEYLVFLFVYFFISQTHNGILLWFYLFIVVSFIIYYKIKVRDKIKELEPETNTTTTMHTVCVCFLLNQTSVTLRPTPLRGRLLFLKFWETLSDLFWPPDCKPHLWNQHLTSLNIRLQHKISIFPCFCLIKS